MRLFTKRVVLAAVLVSTTPALGGILPADDYSRLSDSGILQAWSLANEACQHSPPACEERDAIDREMPARGYCYVGDGAGAHWSKCNGSAPAPAPPQPAQAPPPPVPQPGPPGEAWRGGCSPGAPPNLGGCDDGDGSALYGGPAFDTLPNDPYPMMAEDGNWAEIHAQCVRLRHTIFPTPLEAARARAACRGR